MHITLASGFANYKKSYVKNDFIAALVVTAIAIPESLGFAALVGLPLQTGLYCAFVPPIIFALFTSSRRVVVGADSATASLVAAGAGAVAVSGTANYTSAVTLISLLTAVTLFIMAILRFGFLVNFISKPVLVGFFAGIGVQLMMNKLPDMLGIAVDDGTAVDKVGHVLTHLHQTHLLTLGLSIVVLLVMAAAARTRLPAPLAGLLAGTGLAAIAGLGNTGVELVGSIPPGLPSYTFPHFTLSTALALIPTAISIAFIIIAQGITVIRDFGKEHGEKTYVNQDIVAFSAANALSSLTGGFAINGSPPRTIAAETARSNTAMVNVFMGLLVGILLLFATDALAYVPTAVLAVIIFVIGAHLINASKLQRIYRTRRTEFFIALVAMLGVALFGVRQGVLIAVIVSLIERLHRQYHPSDQILLRDGKLSDWARERLNTGYATAKNIDGLLIYSFNGSLFFDNARYFAHRVRQAVRDAKKPVTTVIIDAGAIDEIDYTAVEVLQDLHLSLRSNDITLGLAHVAPHLRSQLNDFGVIHSMGSNVIYDTLNQAIAANHAAKRDVSSIIQAIKSLHIHPRRYVIIGGAAMVVYGVRASSDIDMVVTKQLYNQLRDSDGWHEYAQENGTCILSHEGFHAMRSWLGYDTHSLRQDARIIEGICYISPAKMIEGKQRLARQKDINDIRLLKKYIREHP